MYNIHCLTRILFDMCIFLADNQPRLFNICYIEINQCKIHCTPTIQNFVVSFVLFLNYFFFCWEIRMGFHKMKSQPISLSNQLLIYFVYMDSFTLCVCLSQIFNILVGYMHTLPRIAFRLICPSKSTELYIFFINY